MQIENNKKSEKIQIKINFVQNMIRKCKVILDENLFSRVESLEIHHVRLALAHQ